MSRISCLVSILLAFALRIYALDAKGLSYDEAATALMARATPQAIIAFHWRAAFEHLPLWQLLMHNWSQVAGQSEFALRYIAVLAGVLVLPLLYQFARRLRANDAQRAFRHSQLTTHNSPFAIENLLLILVPLTPILIYYSQEARMYALVVTVAIAATVAMVQLLDEIEIDQGAARARSLRRPLARPLIITAVILLHWFLLGLHYYSLLFVLAESVFCGLWLLVNRAGRRAWLTIVGTLTVAVTPLLLWFAFAPGFHDTLHITLAGSSSSPPPNMLTFLAPFWRELSFASVRWEVTTSVWGYLWLPLVGLGTVGLLVGREHRENRILGLLPLVAALLPIALSALVFPNLATRYLLYIVPFLLVLMAAGIAWLSQLHWSLAGLALATALAVPTLALPHYFASYQKSEYRAMATYLRTNRHPDEAILLEAPRQHLLTKYYLPADLPIYSAPAIDLPPFWPVNAPPVVPEEMDDVLQAMLHDYRGIWLSLTAEDEVDPGEFIPKYLTAVAFEADCEAWLDVRLCHYLSPYAITPSMTMRSNLLFADDLLLQQSDLSLAAQEDRPFVFVTLHWRAGQQPRADYRVTLRLLDSTGATISQRDSYPIGPLLPPTTWQAGDEKPGYMALPLPADVPGGEYQITVNLYDPTTGAVVKHRHTAQGEGEDDADAAVVIGLLVVTDEIKLREP